MDTGFLLGGTENLQNWIIVMIAQPHECTKQ